MPVQAIGYNTLGPGERVDLSTTDSAVIGLGVSVISTNSYAVFGAGTGQSVAVHGLAAGTVGINWLTGADSLIFVGQAGVVQGSADYAIRIVAPRMQISNHGQILGATGAIRADGVGTRIVNSGLIEGLGTGANDSAITMINPSALFTDATLLVNSGVVRGVSAYVGNDSFDRIENHGAILGNVLLRGGSNTLMNRGSVTGSIESGDGADLIDNRGGTINGVVNLGGGYDQIDNGGGVINGHVMLTQGYVTNRAGTVQGSVSFGDFGDTLDMTDGRVYGQVYLGGGDDLLDSRGTGLVSNGAYGGDGNDSLTGGSAGDWFWGDGDNDDLRGGRGNDTLLGGAGTDLIYGGADDDQVMGDTGNDTLYGGAGEDSLFGGSNEDLMYGGAADDTLDGGGSADRLYGGLGDDTLDGGTNNDMVSGGYGDDELIGNTGNDTLYGGWGWDTLTGGTAADVFVFNTAPDGSVDEITDFSVADDTIRLEDAAFAGLTAGPLAGAAFVANASGLATTSAHRLIYDTDSGALFFDADGSGAGVRVQFAVLSTGLALTAADFVVV